MGKVPNHKAKKGHNKKGTLPSKQAARNRFLNRHIDQVHVLVARAGVTDTARCGCCADSVRVWRRRCGKTYARPPRSHAASAQTRRCHGRQSRSSMRTSPAWASSIVSSLQAPQHHATARASWKEDASCAAGMEKAARCISAPAALLQASNPCAALLTLHPTP